MNHLVLFRSKYTNLAYHLATASPSHRQVIAKSSPSHRQVIAKSSPSLGRASQPASLCSSLLELLTFNESRCERMTMQGELKELLEAALQFVGTRVTVRTAGAIAELVGLSTIRWGEGWLTLGDEGASHVHIRMSVGLRLEFGAPLDANAALCLIDTDGERVLRISFDRTNRTRSDRFDSARLEAIEARFAQLRARSESGRPAAGSAPASPSEPARRED